MTDPQLGGGLLYVIVLVYLAAALWLLCWGVTGLARGYRTWRARRPHPADDHEPADMDTTLASITDMLEGRRQP